MAKGGGFEIEVCRKLSLWWSGGDENADLFWHSAGSGARATVRGKRGRRTSTGYGDIHATTDEGQPFLDVVTPECKRGYNKFTIADLLDRPAHAKQQMWEEWYQQVIRLETGRLVLLDDYNPPR